MLLADDMHHLELTDVSHARAEAKASSQRILDALVAKERAQHEAANRLLQKLRVVILERQTPCTFKLAGRSWFDLVGLPLAAAEICLTYTAEQREILY